MNRWTGHFSVFGTSCDIVLSGHEFRHLLPLPIYMMEIETSLRTTMNENPIYSPTIFNLHIPISMAAWEQAKFNLEGLPMYLSPLRRCQLTSPVSGLRMKALAFFFDPLRYWRNSASRRSLPTVSESQMTVSCFLARVIATFSLLWSLKYIFHLFA